MIIFATPKPDFTASDLSTKVNAQLEAAANTVISQLANAERAGAQLAKTVTKKEMSSAKQVAGEVNTVSSDAKKSKLYVTAEFLND